MTWRLSDFYFYIKADFGLVDPSIHDFIGNYCIETEGFHLKNINNRYARKFVNIKAN